MNEGLNVSEKSQNYTKTILNHNIKTRKSIMYRLM